MARLPYGERAAILHRVAYWDPDFGLHWEWLPLAKLAKQRAHQLHEHYKRIDHPCDPLIASVRVPNGSRAALCAWLNAQMPGPPRPAAPTTRRNSPTAALEPPERPSGSPERPSDPSDPPEFEQLG